MKKGKKPYKLCLLLVQIVGFVAAPKEISCQDPQFSQFYASSLYLNPAFTGNTNQNRLSGTYRHQWPSIPGAFVSYAVAYDHNFAELNSGVGLMITHDKAGSGGLRYNNIAGLYSYAFGVSNKLTARLGAKFSYTFRNYDQSKLVFADQIIRDGAGSSIETDITPGISYPDFSFGGLIYSENFWFGSSIDHINQPNQSFLLEEVQLPYKLSVHGGYKFLIEGDIETENNTSVTLAANYKSQLKWDQVDLGFYYNRNELVLGLWYRGIPILKSYAPGYANNDAIVFLLGLDLKQTRIGYSYDFTISKLIGNTGGSHEIAIIYEWPRQKKRRKRRLVPCAKF